ncbi:hypothetical protein EVAR_44693_1 [Eumeta japonica]|uniref:Uncharacterized protein n=1 Tax=Eumeta variegata TaxID=151549 RepID=A0A4C1XHG6_EUMVA|nr:hypothetical protein EVAR_44693_1 [Eumeta japonica]
MQHIPGKGQTVIFTNASGVLKSPAYAPPKVSLMNCGTSRVAHIAGHRKNSMYFRSVADDRSCTVTHTCCDQVRHREVGQSASLTSKLRPGEQLCRGAPRLTVSEDKCRAYNPSRGAASGPERSTTPREGRAGPRIVSSETIIISARYHNLKARAVV